MFPQVARKTSHSGAPEANQVVRHLGALWPRRNDGSLVSRQPTPLKKIREKVNWDDDIPN